MLDQNKFTIFDHDLFSPSTIGLYGRGVDYSRLGGRSNMRCVQNQTKKQLEQGTYKPRLTVTKRMRDGHFSITLRIEFSIPKLIYGNNFDELVNEDFDQVIDRLQAILKFMGVRVFKQFLINASVSVVHYSKNIPLTDYSTPYTYLKEFTKLNINKNLDTNRTDFRNEGHSFKYRANSFEVVFYDKIKDLKQAKKSDKRAEEKDNGIQLELFEELKKKRPLEVLRMEVRLSGKQKIRHIFGKIDYVDEIQFNNVFSSEVSKRVLFHYLNEIEQCYPPFMKKEAPRDFFEKFIINRHPKRVSTALKALGFKVLMDQIGARELRQIIKPYSSSTWYSLVKEMKALDMDDLDVFGTLRDQIEAFKPLKLIDYQRGMINNDKVINND